MCSIEVHFEGIGGSAGFGIPGANVRVSAGISLGGIDLLPRCSKKGNGNDVHKGEPGNVFERHRRNRGDRRELGGLLSGSRFDVQGLYYAVHPEVYGEKWGTQVQITPVMPSLIKKSIV